MKCVAFLLCLSSIVLGTEVEKAPFIEACHHKDSACNLKSAQKALPHFCNALPQFGLPDIDPFIIDEIKANTGDFKLQFKNLVSHKLRDCKIIQLDRLDKLKLTMKLVCPFLATGNYTCGGNFGIFSNVDGNGVFEINSDAAEIEVSAQLKQFEKDGEKYYKIGSFEYKFEAVKKVHYKFDGLCPGDKAKADLIHQFLNENWKETFKTFSGPILEGCLKKCFGRIGTFLSNIPCKQIELD